MGKESACSTGDTDVDSIPGSGRSLGGGNGNPLQYSCMRNPMDRGAWGATVYGVAKSWTQLNVQMPVCTHTASILITWHLSLTLWCDGVTRKSAQC